MRACSCGQCPGGRATPGGKFHGFRYSSVAGASGCHKPWLGADGLEDLSAQAVKPADDDRDRAVLCAQIAGFCQQLLIGGSIGVGPSQDVAVLADDRPTVISSLRAAVLELDQQALAVSCLFLGTDAVVD